MDAPRRGRLLLGRRLQLLPQAPRDRPGRRGGQPTSTVLGAVDIKGEWDAFSFKVSGADRDVDFGPYLDLWDGDIDWGVSDERSLWAIWTYSRRAILYKDYEMREQIGWLDITGSGTWYEWEEERVVHDTDEDGEVRRDTSTTTTRSARRTPSSTSSTCTTRR